MAVRAGLDMAPEGRRPALHDGARRFADVGGQGMGLLIGGKRVVENHLERYEGHWGLRTRDCTLVRLGVLQYHANHPRVERLVQRWASGAANSGSEARA